MIERAERWFWNIGPSPVRPWWKLHVFNFIGSTVILVVALWFSEPVSLATAAALWGATNMNGLSAVIIRREAVRLGIDLDECSDEAQDAAH